MNLLAYLLAWVALVNSQRPECNFSTAVAVEIVAFNNVDFSYRTTSGHLYDFSEYVRVRDNQSTTSSFIGCECPKDAVCVLKCCPVGFAYNERDDCVPQSDGPHALDLPVYDGVNQLNYTLEKFQVLVDNPCNVSKIALTPNLYVAQTFYFQRNGDVLQADGSVYSANEFCVERAMAESNEVLVYICVDTISDAPIPYRIYSIGMMISVPFLVATFLVYAVIPELRNLHGKSLMCHLAGLTIAYVFISALHLNSSGENEFCVIGAFVAYFFFLSSFFWLNVMCFDICWTFSGFRGFGVSTKRAENKNFIFYSTYAWGTPFVILSVTIFAQFHPAVPKNSIFHPKFGIGKCWFDEFNSLVLYLYGPLLLIILSNVILFLITTLKIVQSKRETAVLNSRNSHKHVSYERNRQRFNLYLKLFIIMGINWTTEIISFFAGVERAGQLWILTDIANTLYGLVIFAILICKRSIWRIVVDRYYHFVGKLESANVSFPQRPGETGRGTSSSNCTELN